MMRFVKGAGSSLLAVLLLGGLVVALAAPDGDESSDIAGSTLAQVEDGGGAEEGSTDEVVAPVGTPIEQLLERVFPSSDAGQSLPSTQRVLLSRDPFRPVVPEPAADGGTDGGGTDGGGTDGGGTDGGGTDGGGTDGGGTDGGGTDGGGTDGGGTDGGGTDGGGTDSGGDPDDCTADDTEAVCDGIVVTLDGFDDDGNVIVTIDGTTFTVGEDEVFATSFRVLSINPPCATLQFGDETFSICTGATVLK